ncbi:YbaB/EbfC family nucleoid-associated protein [Amycolatopsis thermophila]|uniref:DNA-binding protein YbaB n=1 Tax=Amycolatopsis thermophila TaxID=206084 RepID=A0ABU0EVY8_9PSEU|nr:YbaB/EbfC family nucleoid-associated protein [Amycolatopsis thermophila]MDQ0379488.1 DNA-binding protein YbaB [Amycolatopsis thermophila]
MDDLIAEADARVRDAFRAHAERARAAISRPIAGGFGDVLVSGTGVLLDVRLDPARLRAVPEDRLAQAVTEAIRLAERTAAGEVAPPPAATSPARPRRPRAGPDEPEELFTGLADEHRRRAQRERTASCPHCGGVLPKAL